MRRGLGGGILGAWLILWGVGSPLYGEWPERSVTMVTSVPETLLWSDQPAPQSRILAALVPRLSRELGVPVTLVSRPQGDGALAANMVAGARPDGYLFGALGTDSTMTREIQGYTPYIRDEMVPVATGWRVMQAIVVRRGLKADDLRELAPLASQTSIRLACLSRDPVSSAVLMAMEAARAAGFEWALTPVDRADPDVLLEGQAEAMVIPLGYLPYHPRADEFKVVAVLTNEDQLPCLAGRPTLKAQGLDITSSPVFAFYLPAKVSWETRVRLSRAINSTLRQPAVLRALEDDCFAVYREDLEGVGGVLKREYDQQKAALRALGFLE